MQVLVLNDAGQEVLSLSVRSDRISALRQWSNLKASEAEEGGPYTDAEVALIAVAPSVCPFDCDSCREG